MARINLNQLRQWQNGDIIPAQDYNQERNLIIEANNDTNDKANAATQRSQDAIDRTSRLELQPTRIEETSTFQRLTQTLTEGQQIITLPPQSEYLPNTNRVQVFIDGILTPITESSPTQINLLSPARQGQTAVVHWVTELPRVFDIERVEEAIENSRTEFLAPIKSLNELPNPETDGWHIFVQDEKKVYRRQYGQWVAIYGVPQYVGDTLVSRTYHKETPTTQKTVFTLPNHYLPDNNRVDVYLSGVKQRSGVDFTETSTNQVTFQTPVEAGTNVEFVYFSQSQALAEDYFAQAQLAEQATIAAQAAAKVANDSALNRKEPVSTYSALLATPAVKADARMVRDTGKVYRYDGTQWNLIEEIDATVINEVDSRLTSQLADIVTLKPNGVDDTSKIQNALNTHGRVKLGKGTFVTTKLTIGANQALIGSGVGLTTIKLKDNTNTTLINIRNAADSLLTDLTLDGNKANNTTDTTGSVLLVDTTNEVSWQVSNFRLTIERINIVNGANNGLSTLADSNAGVWNWVYLFSNIHIGYCKGYGFYDSTTDNKYSDFYVTHNDKANMYLYNASSNLYSNFKTDGGGWISSGPTSNTNGANIIMQSCSNIQFSNLDVQSGYHSGMKLFYCREIIINGDFNYNGVSTPNPAYDNPGLHFVGCTYIVGQIAFPKFNVASPQKVDCIFDVNCKNISLHCETVDPARIKNSGVNCAITSLSHFTDVESKTYFTLTNLVANGNFTSTTSWIPTHVTLAALANVLSATGDGTGAFAQIQQNTATTFAAGRKYFVRARVRVTNASSTQLFVAVAPTTGGDTVFKYVEGTPAANTWYDLAFIATQTNQTGNLALRFRAVYPDAATQSGKVMEVQYVSVLDLTDLFGAGNEPTLAEMNSMLTQLTNTFVSAGAQVRDFKYYLVRMKNVLNKLGGAV